MILFSHPTGNANVRFAALGLQRSGLLGEFWTCINYQPGGIKDKLLPRSLVSQLARRSFAPELQPLLHTHPWRELARLGAHRLGANPLVRHETGLLSVDAVYRSLDRQVARRLASRPERFKGVYAYEDGAADSFRAAHAHGLKALYDLPIGYWRAARDILVEEAQRQPAWASTLIGNDDSAAKTARKDEELELADAVFVASSYTLKTLQRAPAFKATVQVIPYGAPLRNKTPARPPAVRDGPLRVLFVGSLGQRKGLSYLFDACRQLGSSVALTIIGTKPLEPCGALDGELQRVRWIPSCPHSEVLAEMAANDVFVFPSLFEGFGLVLLEAMAAGLPLITTEHTAGPDLITDGCEGFIVPIRSAEAIASKLDWFSADRDRARQMGLLAQRRAQDFTWEAYGTKLADHVAQACQSRRA